MKKTHPLNIIIFLAAFLLFQIELVIVKIFLPKFGGGYLVWGAAVVFFQATLLLGYLYSHLVVKKIGIFKYRYLHLALLFLPLFVFPGRSLPEVTLHYRTPMVLDVFWQLLTSIGPVFFVLSTTSIIFQSWLAASKLPERKNPYFLYAISNCGSFAGLLTYPFLFESFLNLNTQLLIWRIGYLVLLVLHLIVFKKVVISSEHKEPRQHLAPVRFKEQLRWFLLGAAGVVIFLSVTNMITYEIAPIPLLWIVPLCIYLSSYALNFKRRPWCPVWIKDNFHLVAGLSVALYLLAQRSTFPFVFEVIFFFVSLFIICMFCQNELHKHRPKDSGYLPIFYTIISAGGFIGGIIVSWIMPLITVSMVEYLLGLFLIASALIIDQKKPEIGFYYIRLVSYLLFLIIIWPLVFRQYNFFGVVLFILFFKYIYSELKKKPRAFYLSLLSILIMACFIEPFWSHLDYVHRQRNYYGIYKVYDKRGKRLLIHGTIIHGGQYLVEEKRYEPFGYYHPSTPVGQLLSTKLFSFGDIGIIGLGTGQLTVYGKKGQNIDYFEIDPDMYDIATKYFTYLENSESDLDYLFGDARLSLNQVVDRRYDLIVVDAFSGDSIPVHLLTTEAILKYKDRLRNGGLVLFHISNKYIDLEPVLFANAKVVRAYACKKSIKKNYKKGIFGSNWIIMTWDEKGFTKLTSRLKWQKQDPQKKLRKFRPWTDQYYNIASILDLRGIFSQVKEYRPFNW